MFGLTGTMDKSFKMTTDEVGEYIEWMVGQPEKLVLNKEGAIPISLIGTPHDPLADASWLNIPPSALKKLPKNERACFSRVGPSSKDPNKNRDLTVILKRSTLLGKIYSIDANVLVLYNAVFKESLSKKLQKSNVMATRAAKYYSLPYIETLMIALKNYPKNNEIANKVFKKNCLISLFNDLKNNKVTNYEPREQVKGINGGLCLNTELAVKTLFKDDYIVDEFAALFEMVLSLIENKVELRRAITALWTYSVAADDMGVFCYIYACFPDSFVENDFPHFNFEIIKCLTALLVEDKEVYFFNENLLR